MGLSVIRFWVVDFKPAIAGFFRKALLVKGMGVW